MDRDQDGQAEGCDRNGDGVIDPEPTEGRDFPWPPEGPDCIDGVPPSQPRLALSYRQYDNTVRDLLGLDTQPSQMLPEDSEGSIDESVYDAYYATATAIAEQVIADDDLRSGLVSCSEEQDSCVDEFILEFGQRAFRRPLTEDEFAHFQNLYAEADQFTESGSFDEAIELIVVETLALPPFWMRIEQSEERESEYYRLSDWEVASRLSYTLWATMPDEELFRAAERGELSTSEQILEQAERMVEDPKARDGVIEFHRGYLQMRPGTRWSTYVRDPELFPEFDPDLLPLMSEETERVVAHVMFDGQGSLSDLLTTPVGFVNAELAPRYGLDPADFGNKLELVEHDPKLRPGVLTRVGFLAAQAYYDRTAPILRGVFLQNQVQCLGIPSPEPEFSGITEPVPRNPDQVTNRQRVEAITSDEECVECHAIIDPAGFTLEGFDALGRVQTTDNDQGVFVDTSAEVLIGSSELVAVDGPEQLMQALAASPRTTECYVTRLLEHVYQRPYSVYDECTLGTLNALASQDYPILDLMVLLTQSRSFRLRAANE